MKNQNNQSAAEIPLQLIPSGASISLISLLKSVIYQNINEETWLNLLQHESIIRDYLKGLSLELVVDLSEGYAYLCQRETEQDQEASAQKAEMPRLIQKRPLGYLVSLLCVLLRKRLVEHDSSSGEVRLILTREQILESVRVFLPPSTNEARLDDSIERAINKLADYGFLHRLRGSEENLFEVRRIIKALVDAAWLSEFNQLLEEYKKHANLAL